jgi:hypothetical protein
MTLKRTVSTARNRNPADETLEALEKKLRSEIYHNKASVRSIAISSAVPPTPTSGSGGNTRKTA